MDVVKDVNLIAGTFTIKVAIVVVAEQAGRASCFIPVGLCNPPLVRATGPGMSDDNL